MDVVEATVINLSCDAAGRATSDTLAADAELVGHPLLQLALDPGLTTYDAFPYDNVATPDAEPESATEGSGLVEILRGLNEGGDPNFEIPYEDE